jgi:hypothetical protein
MGYNYDRIGSAAAQMIKHYGFPAVLRRKGPPVASDPWSPPDESQSIDFPITAIMSNYADTERSGTLIRQGDLKIIFVCGTGVVPILADLVVIDAKNAIFGGAPFAIVNIDPTAPGGVPVVYTAQLRR